MTNSKNYRDIVLEYIQKLGEIDKLEDQPNRPKDKLAQLKKEVSNLKQQIDNFKGKNK